MATPDPRSLLNEVEFLPVRVGDLAELHQRVLDAGHEAREAAGIVAWLARKAEGLPDITGSATRSRYRKILAGLDGRQGPKRRRTRVAGSRGAATTVLVEATALGGAAGAAAVAGRAGLAAALALLDITRNPAEAAVADVARIGGEAECAHPVCRSRAQCAHEVGTPDELAA